MGLGKTLQSICIIASSIQLRRESQSLPFPSIVVCPTTIVGNWKAEVDRFCPDGFVVCLEYYGTVEERARTLQKLGKDGILIISYDILRRDIDILKKMFFNYCVLDEGHIIKNSDSAVTKSVKKLSSLHRLLLSGTPIQNNVLELWSLFDFLMPGYLGSKSSFHTKYSAPITLAQKEKSTIVEQENGAAALDKLHKQVCCYLSVKSNSFIGSSIFT